MCRLFFAFLCLCAWSYSGLFASSTSHDLWKQDYEAARKMAEQSGKALLIVFLGSDFCPWSEKLEMEVLNNERFLHALKEEMIFIKMDFPQYSNPEDAGKSINYQLKEKLQVQEFPALVLLDTSGNEITRLGYLPMEPQEFGHYIQETLCFYREIKALIESSLLTTLKEGELENLYGKARNYAFNRFKEEILNTGLQIDHGPFFLMEKYTALVECGKKIDDPELLNLRKEITKRDPKNEKKMHLRLALIDFQTRVQKLKRKDNPKAAIEPLEEYIKRFGSKDRSSIPHLEMMIAQYLFSKNKIEHALTHARSAYEAAPDTAKTDIAEMIEYLKNVSSTKP